MSTDRTIQIVAAGTKRIDPQTIRAFNWFHNGGEKPFGIAEQHWENARQKATGLVRVKMSRGEKVGPDHLKRAEAYRQAAEMMERLSYEQKAIDDARKKAAMEFCAAASLNIYRDTANNANMDDAITNLNASIEQLRRLKRNAT